MNLGENIYRCRTANRLSQGDLASSLSVSRQSVSKWENNSAQPELDKLIKMSDLFQISLDELIFGRAETPGSNEHSAKPTPPCPRALIGTGTLLVSIVIFLLCVFRSEHSSSIWEVGQPLALILAEISLFTLYPHNHRILAANAFVYSVYTLISIGCFHQYSPANTLFLACTSILLLAWFVIWSQHASVKN